MKKKLNISIDEEILNKLKETNINISEFTETMYREYVYGGNTTLKEITAMENEIQNQIQILYGRLALYNKQKQDIIKKETDAEEKIKEAWINAHYKGQLTEEECEKLGEILNIPAETVANIPQYVEMLRTKHYIDVEKLTFDFNYFKQMMEKEFEIII